MSKLNHKPPNGKRPDNRWSGNENLKPGMMANYVRHAMRNWDVEPVDASDINAVRQRIVDYFAACVEDDCKPSVAGVANALGLEYDSLVNWRIGRRRTPEHQRVALTVTNIMREIHETMMQEGTINPIIGIFLSKVHFGYVEKQEITVTARPDPLGEGTPPELLQEKYAESVEVDYTVRGE